MPIFELTGHAIFTNFMDRSQPEKYVSFKKYTVEGKSKRAAITKAVRTEGAKLGVSARAPFRYKKTLTVEEVLPDPPESSGGYTRKNKHGQTEVLTPFGWRVQEE